MLPNLFTSVAPPPPPLEQPPPPPPPQQNAEQLNTATFQMNQKSSITTTTNPAVAQSATNANTQLQQSQNPIDNQLQSNRITNFEQSSESHDFNAVSDRSTLENRRNHQDNNDNFRNRNRNNRNWVHNNRFENSRSNLRDNNFGNRRDDDYNQGSSSPQHQKQQPQQSSELTAEKKSEKEIAFDAQFRKWEEELNAWKRNNADHPDRRAYNDFLQNMENIRETLLKKRESLRQNRLDRQQDMQQNRDDFERSDSADRMEDVCSNASSMAVNSPKENDEKSQATTTTNLFGANSDAGIPGLDLVTSDTVTSESANKEKSTEKVEILQSITIAPDVSAINNILGDPNLKSLLSNIQMQQNTFNRNIEQEPLHDLDDRQMPTFSEDRDYRGSNQFDSENCKQNTNRLDEDLRRIDNFDSNIRDQFNENLNSNRDDMQNSTNQSFRSLMDINVQNPYINQDRGGNVNRERCIDDYDDNNPAKKRRWNDTSNDFQQQQQQQRNFNQYDDSRSFNSNNIRNNPFSRHSGLDFDNQNLPDNDSNVFKPAKVFDYQNQSQQMPNNMNAPMARQTITVSTFGQQIINDEYPRRIIEYNHQTKVLPMNSFCPIKIIEYDHTVEGLSMHEHPPPKQTISKAEPAKQERAKEETYFQQQQQQRHPRWQQQSYGSNEYHRRRDPAQNQPLHQQQRYADRGYQPYYRQTTGDNNPPYNRQMQPENPSYARNRDYQTGYENER